MLMTQGLPRRFSITFPLWIEITYSTCWQKNVGNSGPGFGRPFVRSVECTEPRCYRTKLRQSQPYFHFTWGISYVDE